MAMDAQQPAGQGVVSTQLNPRRLRDPRQEKTEAPSPRPKKGGAKPRLPFTGSPCSTPRPKQEAAHSGPCRWTQVEPGGGRGAEVHLELCLYTRAH
jgi:hypothetical protein